MPSNVHVVPSDRSGLVACLSIWAGVDAVPPIFMRTSLIYPSCLKVLLDHAPIVNNMALVKVLTGNVPDVVGATDIPSI